MYYTRKVGGWMIASQEQKRASDILEWYIEQADYIN